MGRKIFAVSLSVAISACGPLPPASGAASAFPSSRQIEASHLAGYAGSTALDVVERARPHWLRTRGEVLTGYGGIQVYVDGVRAGGLAALGAVPVGNVKLIRKYSASEATLRFGTGHLHGAIEVTTN